MIVIIITIIIIIILLLLILFLLLLLLLLLLRLIRVRFINTMVLLPINLKNVNNRIKTVKIICNKYMINIRFP